MSGHSAEGGLTDEQVDRVDAMLAAARPAPEDHSAFVRRAAELGLDVTDLRTGAAGAVLGEEARRTILAAVQAADGPGSNYPRLMWNLEPVVAALVAAAEVQSRTTEAEAIYTAIYERYVRPVDPDLEGYSPDELVGLLLDAVKDAAEERGAAAGAEMARAAVSYRLCELAGEIRDGHHDLAAVTRTLDGLVRELRGQS